MKESDETERRDRQVGITGDMRLPSSAQEHPIVAKASEMVAKVKDLVADDGE